MLIVAKFVKMVHRQYSYHVGEVYSIQHYVIEFVGDLRHVDGFLRVLWISYKTDRHDIAEILLKVALNTITIIIT
jgi:hypothetical protein